MRNIIRAALTGLLLCVLIIPAHALDLFWVGGTANWDGTAGSKWSLTSGGVGGVALPGAGDDVHFDANSGAGTITYTLSSTMGSLDFTGFTGTFTQNATTLTMDGGGTNDVFKLVAGMTYNAAGSNRIVQFTNTAGAMALTSAGKTLPAITQNGAGGSVQLQDALTFRSDSTITVTAGSMDFNGKNVTGGLLSSSNTNTRSIVHGAAASLLTLNATAGSPLDFTTGTNLTYTKGGSSVLLSSVGVGQRSFVASGQAFGPTTFVDGSTARQGLLFGGTATFDSFTISPPLRLQINGGSTLTATAFSAVGTSPSNNILIEGQASSASVGTVSVASGSPLLDWLTITKMTFSGGATFNATNSFDNGGNTGITFSPFSSGGGRCIGC